MKLHFEFSTIFIMAQLGALKAQEMCLDATGNEVGPAGPFEINDGTIELQSRRGGSACPCSYVNTKCTSTIDGNTVDCGDIVVNGTAATAGGVDNYPDVTLDYSMELCNYNDYPMEFSRSQSSEDGESNYMLFWFNDPWPDRTYIEEERFCEIGQACGEAVRLEKQTCLSIPQKSVTTTTRRSEYFMQAQLHGPLVDENTGGRVDDGFCYAYAFDPISFRYDYGDGECLVNTEISCKVVDSNGVATEESCAERIEAMNRGEEAIENFDSIIEGRACNNNARDIFLQYEQCNLKVSTYGRNGRGRLRRVTVKYDDRFVPPDNVADPATPMRPNECQDFSFEKEIDPRQPNFHQINIQGMLFNNFNGNMNFFRDKDCHDFSFENLPIVTVEPIVIPENPSDSPSISVSPSTKPSVSVVPSASPTLSKAPSLNPTVSQAPSDSPSISTAPSSKPSLSVVPSESPTLSQTPSSKPSISMTPSHIPSNPIGKGGKGGKGSNSWSYSYKSPTNGGSRTRALNAHKNRKN